MQIRNVLRIYSLLRNLTDDETALLETLRSLSDGDREQLVETMAPAKPAVRKRKPRAKSQRASSMAGTLDKNLSAQREAALKDVTGESDDDTPLYQQRCGTCGNAFGHEDHSQPSPHYHPFAPPAQSARGQSSRNGERASSGASSETGAEDVGGVAHAANKGANSG